MIYITGQNFMLNVYTILLLSTTNFQFPFFFKFLFLPSLSIY